MAKVALSRVSNSSFTAAMQLLLSKPLPIRTAFKVKTLVNTFNGELAKFGELRKEILERHCKKKEDGSLDLDEKKNYQFAPESLDEVSKEMTELFSIEVDVQAITLEELGNIELTAQQLFDLGEVVEA